METADVSNIRKALIFPAGFMTTRCPSNDSFEEAESRSFPNAASGDDHAVVSLAFVSSSLRKPRSGYPESTSPDVDAAQWILRCAIARLSSPLSWRPGMTMVVRSRRAARQIVGKRAIGQRLGQMQAGDFLGAIEIGQGPRHPEHA